MYDLRLSLSVKVVEPASCLRNNISHSCFQQSVANNLKLQNYTP